MNIPSSFAVYTRELLGDEEYGQLLSALSEEPAVSVRINKRKWPDRCLDSVVRKSVPWCGEGYYLESRPSFTFDPYFHAGCYYVQEASSMFVGQAVRQHVHKPVVALDLCAAPGGKSTHLCDALPGGSLLVANEVMRSRVQVLAENLTKWGASSVVVTHNDPADFSSLEAFFDVILTDVPCSGEGMFRKDEGAVEEWSPENVRVCWQRQRRILADVWPALRPGGILIYSTCTYNIYEDEENVRWICEELGAEVLPVQTDPAWNITGNLCADQDFPVYRFLPHRTRGEGFFLAVLRKRTREGEEAVRSVPALGKNARKAVNKKDASAFSKDQTDLMKSWLADAGSYMYVSYGSVFRAFPKAYERELAALQHRLRIVQAGVMVGEAKGKDCLPAHALSMSPLLRKGCFPCVDLDYDQAIAYLRKEAILLDGEVAKGYVLVAYHGVPLGFVKNIGNRANNLYPQEWRIRSRG